MAGKRVLAGVLAAISLLFTACGAAPAAEAAETEETFPWTSSPRESPTAPLSGWTIW